MSIFLGSNFSSLFDYNVSSTKEGYCKPNFDHENTWYDRLQWTDMIAREEYAYPGGIKARNADFIGPFRLQDQCMPFDVYY